MSTSPVVTTNSNAALSADASNRAQRTFWQAAALDVVLAVALYVSQLLTDKDGWSELDLKIISFMLFKTCLLALAAYVMRRFIDEKTGILLPPAPTPEPANTDEETDTDLPEVYVNNVDADPSVELADDQSPEPDVPDSVKY